MKIARLLILISLLTLPQVASAASIIQFGPPAKTGNNGWYVEKIYYRSDFAGGAGMERVTLEGSHSYQARQAPCNNKNSIQFRVDDQAWESAVGCPVGTITDPQAYEYSDTLQLKVDSEKPSLEVSSPGQGQSVLGDVLIEGVASDVASGIESVTIDSAKVDLSSQGRFSKSFDLPDGEQNILIIAKDVAGNTTEVTRVVSVKHNEAAVMQTTQPASTQSSTLPKTTEITEPVKQTTDELQAKVEDPTTSQAVASQVTPSSVPIAETLEKTGSVKGDRQESNLPKAEAAFATISLGGLAIFLAKKYLFKKALFNHL